MPAPLSFTDAAIDLLGFSGATTYAVLRAKGAGASAALARARAQILVLGRDYPGGFACLPFRRMSALNS